MSSEPMFEFRDVACPVCDSTARAKVGWRGGAAHHGGLGVRTEIVRCNSCTHLYPYPMPFPVGGSGSLYINPEEYFSAHDVEAKKRIGLEIIKIAERKLGRRGAILDVGCGRGELLWAAREGQWDFAGLDPSPAHLKWAKEKLGIEGQLGTLGDMNYADEKFDIVIMGGVLEHLYEPYQTLREVWRVLRPGGLFYFDAPNEDALYSRIGNLYLRGRGRDWVVNLAPTFPPFHVQGFNPSSLKRLLQRVGFEVDEFSITGNTFPATGRTSLRKRLEHRAAQIVNWVGRHSGSGVYMDVWARRPQVSPPTNNA